jgi:hypothetical protein
MITLLFAFVFEAVAVKGPESANFQKSGVPSFKVKVKETLGIVLLTGEVVTTVPVPVTICVVGVTDPVGVHTTELKVSAVNVKLWVGFVV